MSQQKPYVNNYRRILNSIKLLRFIENHDEARAAEILSIPRLKAASVLINDAAWRCLLLGDNGLDEKHRNHVLLGETTA